MSFIDDSEKNIDRLMKEESTGGVSGFVGGSGMSIDQLFAGPFHPDSGHGSENKKLLQKQLQYRKKQRAEIEKEAAEQGVELIGNPNPIGGHFSIDTEIIQKAFDELQRFNDLNKQYSDANTPIQDTEWTEEDVEFEYDEIGEPYKVREIEYDDIPERAGDNYINNSEVNMSYVGKELKYDKFDQSMGRNKRNKIFAKSFIERSEENVKEVKGIKLSTGNFLDQSKVNFDTIYNKDDIKLSVKIGS